MDRYSNNYDLKVIGGVFKDEFEYWDAMSEYSIKDKHIVYYNFEKVGHILNFLCRYDLFSKSIIEVGVGLGFVAKALISGGQINHYTATECGEGYIDYVKNTSSVDVVKTTMDSLPFDDKRFDTVFLFDVLEHIKPENRVKSYAELSRVLKDKRSVFINNPSNKNLSFHNKSFDNKFGFTEIEAFAESLGICIKDIKHYICNGYSVNAPINHYHIMEVSN